MMDPAKKERIDLLYKNLDCNSQAYTTAESGFSSWEAAYALIVGQLFIAYFQVQETIPHIFIAVFGLILSASWFFLVSLNLQNAIHMNSKLQELYSLLRLELGCTQTTIRFIEIYPDDSDKKNWRIRDILLGNKPGEQRPSLNKMVKSTWSYRRILPLVLFVSWSILLFLMR